MSVQRRYYSADGQKIFGTRRKAPYIILFLNFLVILGMLLYYNSVSSGPKEAKMTSSEGLELLLRRTEVSKEKTMLLSLEIRNVSGRTLRLEEDSAVFRDADGTGQRVASGKPALLAPGDERVFRSVWPQSGTGVYTAEIGLEERRLSLSLVLSQTVGSNR